MKNCTREADRGNNMVLPTPDCEIQTRYFELTEGWGGFWGSSDWLMVTNYFHREILVTTSCISHCKKNISCDPTTAPSFFVAAAAFLPLWKGGSCFAAGCLQRGFTPRAEEATGASYSGLYRKSTFLQIVPKSR